MAEAFGVKESGFLYPLIEQLANAVSPGSELDERKTNFALAVVKGVDPHDQMEAMLAAQMAAVHLATMQLARKLNHVETIPQQDSAANAFAKLSRTYAKQMEALRRYRSGGQQTVTVQHVTVQDGGQAVVGNVGRGGGDGEK